MNSRKFLKFGIFFDKMKSHAKIQKIIKKAMKKSLFYEILWYYNIKLFYIEVRK